MDFDTNALESKLNAVLDRSSKDPISPRASPSLASTSSEALQYSSAVYREPLTEDERARRDQNSERLLTEFWGDEPTRRADEERFKRQQKALRDLAIHGWGMCEMYEKEVSKLAKGRAAEDSSRNISAEGYAPTWTENDQRALEFQRQKEDYVVLAENLSVFLDGDEESEDIEALRYRLRNLKNLLRIYDSQYHESSRRLQEDIDTRKQQMRNLTGNGVSDYDSEEQRPFHNPLSGRDQKNGPVANESLYPVGSSKISKASRGNRIRPRRRQNISQEASSGVDAAEPQPSPDRVTPRRSKRIKPPFPSVANDPTRTASTVPPKRAVRLKPERNVRARSSAKPQGISKRQPTKTTRGKARKKMNI